MSMPHRNANKVKFGKQQRLRIYQSSAGAVADSEKDDREEYDLSTLVPSFTIRPSGLLKWVKGWAKSILSYTIISLKMYHLNESFSLDLIKREASLCYKEVYQALASHDIATLKRYVTEDVMTALKKRMVDRDKVAEWSVNDFQPRLRAVRYVAVQGDQRKEFGQITVQFNTMQKLVIKDKGGKVIAGKDSPVNVNEIWVFERDVLKDGMWKVVGRLKAQSFNS